MASEHCSQYSQKDGVPCCCLQCHYLPCCCLRCCCLPCCCLPCCCLRCHCLRCHCLPCYCLQGELVHYSSQNRSPTSRFAHKWLKSLPQASCTARHAPPMRRLVQLAVHRVTLLMLLNVHILHIPTQIQST